MRTVVGWIAAVLLVVGIGVGAEAIGPGPTDPFGQSCIGCVSIFGPAYVGTPRTFSVPVIVSLGSPSAVITSAWVPDLPAGLSATVLAVQPGVYALNCTGCPGDPRHNAADASALTRFPVTVQPGEQEDLLVVLNADHLGTFSIEGFDVAWRSGGEEGTPAGDCRRCRG